MCKCVFEQKIWWIYFTFYFIYQNAHAWIKGNQMAPKCVLRSLIVNNSNFTTSLQLTHSLLEEIFQLLSVKRRSLCASLLVTLKKWIFAFFVEMQTCSIRGVKAAVRLFPKGRQNPLKAQNVTCCMLISSN